MANICNLALTNTSSTFKKYDLIEGTKLNRNRTALCVTGSSLLGGVAGGFAGFAIAAVAVVVPYIAGIFALGLLGAIIGASVSSVAICLSNRSLKAQHLEETNGGETSYNQIKNQWNKCNNKINDLNLEISKKNEEIKDLQPRLIEERQQQSQLAEQKYLIDSNEYNKSFDKMINNLRSYWCSQINTIKYNKHFNRVPTPPMFPAPRMPAPPVAPFSARRPKNTCAVHRVISDEIITAEATQIINIFEQNGNNNPEVKSNLISQLMSKASQINESVSGNINLRLIQSGLEAVLNQCPPLPVKTIIKGGIENHIDLLNSQITEHKNSIDNFTTTKYAIEELYNIKDGEFPDLETFKALMPE